MISIVNALMTIQTRETICFFILHFSGIFNAGFDQLWNYHLLHHFTFPTLRNLTPVTWFSIIEAGIVITNFCGTSIVKRRVNTIS